MKRFVEFVTPTGLEIWIDTDKIVAVTFPKTDKPSKYCFVFVGPGDSDSYTITIPTGWSNGTFMKFISEGED